MSTSSRPTRTRKPQLSLDTWAVLAAAIFVILIVIGVLPRVPW
jgi:hypothetical protein